MLNYPVAFVVLEVMTTPEHWGLRSILACSALAFATARSVLPRLQSPGFAEVVAPEQHAVLQGVVTIEGTAAHPGFVAYELSFAYDPDPTGTWFPLGEAIQSPIQRGRLGLWDTAQITDGEYQLRLRVWLDDGRILTDVVEGLRVRNVRPIETGTPGGAVPTRPPVTETQVPPTSTSTPTPAPGPASQVGRAFLTGGLAATAGLGLLAAYLRLRVEIRSAAARARASYFKWRSERSNRRVRRG